MLSRHAEAVYWLGRCMERVENTARITDVTYRTLLETSHITHDSAYNWEIPLDVSFERFRFLGTRGHRIDNDEQVLQFLCFEAENPDSVLNCLERARQNAMTIRDEVSSEMVEELNKFYRWMLEEKTSGRLSEHPHEFLQEVKTRCHLFEGVTANTMLRDEGWQFHLAGRWLERGMQTARLLEVQYARLTAMPDNSVSPDNLLWISVLRSMGAYEAYRRHYVANVRPRGVVELIVLNPAFPRSVALCTANLVRTTAEIARVTSSEGSSEPNRLARRLAAQLSTSLVDEVLMASPPQFLADCQEQFRRIHDALSATYFSY